MNKVEFYTIKDLQSVLHIGKNKAYALCKLKLFPTIRIGNKTLIYKAEFEKWLFDSQDTQIHVN